MNPRQEAAVNLSPAGIGPLRSISAAWVRIRLADVTGSFMELSGFATVGGLGVYS
jgi:hypothetical protein